jgi:serine/threonine-protein kinase
MHMPDLEATVVAHPDPMLRALVDGRYQIDHKIAEGGFGAVYCAIDTVTRRVVALKVLHSQLTTDVTVVARFRREAEILSRLHDPHTVALVGAGTGIDGTSYIAMEMLSGPSLLELQCALGTLPWERVATIVRGVCRSLAEVHALGIVHRDLKPTNIHLEPTVDQPDFVKVIDFGIAKPVGVRTNEDLTRVGHMIGTTDYMSPEQMLGGTCTPHSDIFALGILMYELIAGCRPYGNPGSAPAMIAAVLGTTPPLLLNVPVELAQIVARCLACEPTQRFADAAELGAALDAMFANLGAYSEERDTELVVILDRPRFPRLQTIPGHAIARPHRTPKGTGAPSVDAAPDQAQVNRARLWLALLAIVLGIVALLASS